MSIQFDEVGDFGEWTLRGSSAQALRFSVPVSLAPCWPQLDHGLMRAGLRHQAVAKNRSSSKDSPRLSIA